MKTIRSLLALCTAALSLAAQAHPMLDHADPKVGATAPHAPAEVRLWFTEELEPAFTSVTVVDPAGKSVAAGAAQVDAHDRQLLHVPLRATGPGAYTVIWRVVGIDTHATQGRFTFHVAR